MTLKIVTLHDTVSDNLKLPVETVLNAALTNALDSVLVIGDGEDGLYIASSEGKLRELIGMLEEAKHQLLQLYKIERGT